MKFIHQYPSIGEQVMKSTQQDQPRRLTNVIGLRLKIFI